MPASLIVGIIGAGRMGRTHAAILAGLPGVQVAVIADPDPQAAATAAAACAGARTVADATEVLAHPQVQAVVICSPAPTHARWILHAAATGRHVFCEKPLDIELPPARQAVASAREAGITLQVGFNRRFDPAFARLAHDVRQGAIGAPHLIRITSRDPTPPAEEFARAGGGLFLDMTIHDLDMARFVTGDEVVEVFASGGALIDPSLGDRGDLDTAVTTLRMRSGALCAIDNSRRAVYGYDQRVEVLGSEGCRVAGEALPAGAALGGARAPASAPAFFLERYHASYVAELTAFVQCVRDALDPPVTGQDGLAALELAIAARRSLAERRAIDVS